MGYYVNQKCGSCKKSLTGGYVGNYSGVGEPSFACNQCGAINDNSDRVTEWKLRSHIGKCFFIIQHVFSVLFVYGFGMGIVSTVLLAKGFINSMTELAIIVGIGCMVGLFVFFTRLKNAIRASDARMEDVSYVRKLRSLGMI